MRYNGRMIGFLVGLIVAVTAAVGLYYYMFMQDPEVRQEERGGSANVQVNPNVIPKGAIMEDGTLPE
jgi:hypothetical protein